jgi:hypothetical protein
LVDLTDHPDYHTLDGKIVMLTGERELQMLLDVDRHMQEAVEYLAQYAEDSVLRMRFRRCIASFCCRKRSVDIKMEGFTHNSTIYDIHLRYCRHCGRYGLEGGRKIQRKETM